MLRRLGLSPHLCVCDNGSVDGMPEALVALDPTIDFPHRFILNPRNVGSSIARNQIIDYMLECDADYLLMMDGDIEVVPFSSFSMVRHMENSGRRLGCVGPDSSGHTPHREQASTHLPSVPVFDDAMHANTNNYVAWTQYGMFRRAVFDDGVRFEARHPFDGRDGGSRTTTSPFKWA